MSRVGISANEGGETLSFYVELTSAEVGENSRFQCIGPEHSLTAYSTFSFSECIDHFETPAYGNMYRSLDEFQKRL